MEADNVWEKIKRSLKDGASMSVEKIEEYTKVGKLKVEEMAAKRKIERNFVDIGERVYDLVDEGRNSEVPEDIVIKKAVENVKELRTELDEIAEKIRNVPVEVKAAKQENCDEEVTGV